MKLGILGGTFDPIHRAHLALAQTAREQLDLDAVALMVSADPPLKGSEVSPARTRAHLVDLATADAPGLHTCRLELDRAGPSYTVDTLEALHERRPEAELWWIVGADSLSELEAWHRPERLFELANFAVAQRPGSPKTLAELLPPRLAASFRDPEDPALPPDARVHASGHVLRPLAFEPRDVSATRIRDHLRSGHSARHWLPDAVARYLDAHPLYLAPSQSEES